MGLSNFTVSKQNKDIAAYLLLVLGGNASPSADDIKKLLGSVGAEPSENVNKLVEELNGKDVNEVIAAGSEKLAASGVSLGAGGNAGGAGNADANQEEVADEPEEEEEEEEEDGGGGMMGLFGGGSGSDDDSDGGFGLF